MKRIRLIALDRDKDELLSGLLHAGCVEIRESAPVSDGEGEPLLRPALSNASQVRGWQNEIRRAVTSLGSYAPQKTGMFPPRDAMAEKDLLSAEALQAALELADKVNGLVKDMNALASRETRLQAEQLSLQPWRDHQLPLEMKGTKTVSVLLGTIPAAADYEALAGALSEAAPATRMICLSTDREQQYLSVISHKANEAEALECLRSYGFGFAQLKELTGTVAENIAALEKETAETSARREELLEEIRSYGPCTKDLQVALDRVQQVLSKEEAKERLQTGGALLYLEGWLEASQSEKLEALLNQFDCAYEITDPDPEEYPEVPVKLKNNCLTRCMNVVTEMYSLPAYDGTDPNPLMFPFFVVFFGMMMADMAYGALMVAAALFVLKKRPKEGARNFMEGVLWCGVSTFVWGALSGGFFGDFIPQLLKVINPASTFAMPALFTPLDDTMAIMIGSLALGCIQIITGMTVSIINKIKAGDFMDALFDEITWWIIIGGIVLAVLGVGSVSGIPVVLVFGILMLVFGGTRNAKGFGKLTKLVGLVYNGVTGYFSDILSYVRLMALMLSGSVIASVFNTLGATFGNVILFVIVAMIGNALNLVLNLLGCYVHTLRLQCLEFFGRFYKEGGRPYRPLAFETNYVDIIKEEN
ncbi:MAG: V-type ATP synthase subunit I [Oscillospiraceae bacterium]|nr:V-type ATP synthase subunit I [Oscillospiraceae bacterium]